MLGAAGFDAGFAAGLAASFGAAGLGWACGSAPLPRAFNASPSSTLDAAAFASTPAFFSAASRSLLLTP